MINTVSETTVHAVDENAKTIDALYASARYWHGTGRYKYGETGQVIDILKGMIKEGGLVPHDDDWDWKLGNIKSISLARARMYGRLYAGMYMPNEKRIDDEYGPRWLWFQYFFRTAGFVGLLDYRWYYWIVRDFPGKRAVWTQKITAQQGKTLRSVFEKGTDIIQNYPILVGVKNDSIKPIVGSRVFNIHETRTESLIGFKGMTHIEVPRKNIVETIDLLKYANIDTPVIPIEEGESYCRRFSFFKLVSGQVLIV